MRTLFALFLIAYSSISASENSCFDDERLAKLQADLLPQGAGVLLYVWSPRMVLSAHYAAMAQVQAHSSGLRFVALHNAQVSQTEVHAALDRMVRTGAAGLQNSADAAPRSEGAPPRSEDAASLSAGALRSSLPLCAPALLERDAQRHFPTAWVLHRSGLHARPIIGAMPAQAWADSLAQRAPKAFSPTVQPDIEPTKVAP